MMYLLYICVHTKTAATTATPTKTEQQHREEDTSWRARSDKKKESFSFFIQTENGVKTQTIYYPGTRFVFINNREQHNRKMLKCK